MKARPALLLSFLLVLACFTNFTSYTVRHWGLPLLPLLFLALFFLLLVEAAGEREWSLSFLRGEVTGVVLFFALLYLTCGMVNARWEEALRGEFYLAGSGLVLFFFLATALQKREEVTFLLYAVVLAGPFLAVQGLFQLREVLTAAVVTGEFRAGGWWEDPNTYALVLDLVYLASFFFLDAEKKSRRWLAFLAQVSAALGVFLSLSRSGLVIFLLLTFLNLPFLRKRKRYAFFFFGLLAVMMATAYVLGGRDGRELEFPVRRLWAGEEEGMDFSSGRLEALKGGLKIYALHPLMGVGFGNLLGHAEAFGTIRQYTHNMYAEILATAGPLPLAGYFLLLFTLGRTFGRLWPGDKRLGQVGQQFAAVLPVMSLFAHFLLFLKPVWVMLALMAVLSAPGREKRCTS